MNLSRVIRISRPRFWIYELGPYMIGILSALLLTNCVQYGGCGNSTDRWVVGIFAVYFLICGNIWIYGINDIYDYETDSLNPKKLEGYEALVTPSEQKHLRRRIMITTVPFMFLALILGDNSIYVKGNILYEGGIQYSFLGFLFFSGQYSAYPIRAKAKPIIDMIFSAGHYVTTAIFAWMLIAPISEINWRYVIAGMCWCMAMHLYSAIPDIQADRDAGLSTTAMLTGERGGLVVCAIFYLLAAIMSYPVLGVISIVLCIVYLVMMIWTWVRLRDISQIYRYFPWINMISGMSIFLVLLYRLIYG